MPIMPIIQDGVQHRKQLIVQPIMAIMAIMPIMQARSMRYKQRIAQLEIDVQSARAAAQQLSDGKAEARFFRTVSSRLAVLILPIIRTLILPIIRTLILPIICSLILRIICTLIIRIINFPYRYSTAAIIPSRFRPSVPVLEACSARGRAGTLRYSARVLWVLLSTHGW